MRATHEARMLELVAEVRARQVLEAKANKENLEKARESARFRVQHYADLLGNEVTIPDAPTIAADLTADTQLPADTAAQVLKPDVDESLAESEERGVKLIPREMADLNLNALALESRNDAGQMESLASMMNYMPTFGAHAQPLGPGGSVSFGGSNIGAAISAMAKVPQLFADSLAHRATVAAKMATYIRREQEWTLQANLAMKEIIQLDKQITSADIRIQVSEKELANHEQQIADAEEVELFLKDKFTNQELYQWIKERLFAVYKPSYDLAYEMALKAEKACKYELGSDGPSIIQYGYWDSTKQGLLAGEQLQLALRQLERSYLDENRRERELTKSVSLARLNPLALIQLRETGRCYVSLPEELFDLDFRGHYFRRVKAVRLSIPCIAGPHTSVSCSLRLLNNSFRINTSMNSAGAYEHENDEGLWIDDDRFRTNVVPVTAIATSSAQADSGMLEFSFRDERYLPFERAGVISEWQIELSTEKEPRQFDYDTIADVILHLDYTAREEGGLFKERATTYIKSFLANAAELNEQPLMQMFSLRTAFPTEWYKFLHPATLGDQQILTFTLGHQGFPFFAQERDVIVMKMEVFAKAKVANDYHLIVSYIDLAAATVTSTQMTASSAAAYGSINRAVIEVDDAGLNLEELDVTKAMNVKLKRSTVADFKSLAADELEDVFLVVHYKLGDPV